MAEQLARAIEAGDELELGRLVRAARQRAIEAAIAGVGAQLLKPIQERIGEEFSHDEIRFVRAGILRAQSKNG